MLHAGFALTGVLTTLLGPVLPALSGRWNIGDAQAGLLFTAQFLASMCGALLGSRVAPRRGVRAVIAAGFALCAAGLALTAAGRWSIGVAGVALYGLGLGLVIPLTNLLVAALNPSRRSEALNVLNFAWGLGAVVAPPALAAILPRTGLPGFLWGLAFLMGGAAAVVSRGERMVTAENGPPGPKPVWRQSWIWLTGAFLFLYVGVENGLAGWMPSYAARELNASAAFTAAAQAAFWGAILGFRLLAPALLRHLPPARLILCGLGCGIAGMLLLIALPSNAGLISGVVVAGTGLSAVFPTAVALFSERAAGLGSRVTGAVFAMAALGGATIPSAAGAISARSGSLRFGLMAPFVCGLLMIGIRMSTRPQPKSRAATSLPA